MILPQPDLLNRFNAYALVVVAAKRAKYLQERLRADQGNTPIYTDASAIEPHRRDVPLRSVIKTDSRNPLTVALEEIAAGRVIPSADKKWPEEPMALPQQPDVLETALADHLSATPDAAEGQAGMETPAATGAAAEMEDDDMVSYDGHVSDATVDNGTEPVSSLDEIDFMSDIEDDAAARDAAADMERVEIDPEQYAARLAGLDQLIKGAMEEENLAEEDHQATGDDIEDDLDVEAGPIAEGDEAQSGAS